MPVGEVRGRRSFAMATNPDFLQCKEERENESFFKVLQSVDTSSENIRAIPHDFSRNLSDDELSGTMKIRARWGRSWEIGISKNPRFYFMEKAGWEKFVRDNFLGDSELLTFIHKGNMRFNVIIYKQDGKEMVKPPQSMAFLASSSRIKTEQDVVSPDLTPTTAETNGGGKYKKKLDLGKKKEAKESQNSKTTKKAVSSRRDSAGASSSSVAEFTTLILESYLINMAIPASVRKHHMPEERTTFRIHYPDMKKSWDLVYLPKHSKFSAGWTRLVEEYPITIGDICKFTFIKPTELVLVVSKP